MEEAEGGSRRLVGFSVREPPFVDQAPASPLICFRHLTISLIMRTSAIARARGFVIPPEGCSIPLSRYGLSNVLRCFCRHCAESGGHFAHDRFGVGDIVSLRDPTRFVIGKPCCARRVFPNECLQWQIDSNCLHRLHQRRTAAGVTEDNELSRS